MSYVYLHELLYGAALVALIIGSLLFYLGIFATRMVAEQLKRQKIYFPERGSKSFSPEKYPEIQEYAGQMIDNGAKAKAYAMSYLGRHVETIAAGMTYAEVSAASIANPSDDELKKKCQLLFQGETLMGLLVGCAYAYGTFAKIAKIAGMTCIFVGLILLAWGFTTYY